jgi:hypothetical protein
MTSPLYDISHKYNIYFVHLQPICPSYTAHGSAYNIQGHVEEKGFKLFPLPEYQKGCFLWKASLGKVCLF